MKANIEISDELLKRAKATAAIRGKSLQELIREALETSLSAVPQQQSERSGWRSVFGLAKPKSVENVDRILSADLKVVDLSEWR
ncbi:MAG: hypothetical protein M3P06_15055 [Acidobacteriota bacterium]|nr:hypothetical protein [Acidobacteriota bacterium]